MRGMISIWQWSNHPMQDWTKFQQRKPAHKLLKSSKAYPKLHSSYATISKESSRLRYLCTLSSNSKYCGDQHYWQDAWWNSFRSSRIGRQSHHVQKPRRLVSRPQRLQQNSAITARLYAPYRPTVVAHPALCGRSVSPCLVCRFELVALPIVITLEQWPFWIFTNKQTNKQ